MYCSHLAMRSDWNSLPALAAGASDWADEETFVAVTALDPPHLAVAKLARAADFYARLFGFHVSPNDLCDTETVLGDIEDDVTLASRQHAGSFVVCDPDNREISFVEAIRSAASRAE